MTTPVAGDARSSPDLVAEVLLQALPYIQRFRGKVVVVKLGGNAMVDETLAEGFAADVVLMHSVGMLPVVVHGGGPQISDLMERLGKEVTFRDGLRVTDAESLDITRMVLVGKVNRDVVAQLNRHGPLAVGVSGEDAGLIRASVRDPALGYVGDVEAVNPAIVERLLSQGLVPVISTTGTDADGQAYNINADTVAGALAVALGAEKVVFLTDVEGLMRKEGDPDSLVSRVSASELRLLVDEGVVGSGMIPKVDSCLSAVEQGVGSAHMVNGTRPHVLLLELLTDRGIGTMVTRYTVPAASVPEEMDAAVEQTAVEGMEDTP
ncbi:MAG: acetylglutamate kinase [Actinomycetota bacterium]|nr:acetylglutamate kinase [Actinomycetota bacterium]